MSKTAAIPMDKEIQSFQFIFTGQQYFLLMSSNNQEGRNKFLPVEESIKTHK